MPSTTITTINRKELSCGKDSTDAFPRFPGPAKFAAPAKIGGEGVTVGVAEGAGVFVVVGAVVAAVSASVNCTKADKMIISSPGKMKEFAFRPFNS